MFNKYLLTVFLISYQLFFSINTKCEDKDISSNEINNNSIELSPLSPFIKIYAVQYGYQFSSKGEMILGLAYMNIHNDVGNTNAPALILGYRHFLWKKLHLEYQIWPTYYNFYEKNEAKYYKSFDIWNEFRLGYQFDFEVSDLPVFASVQWPFGFGLYASNKPQSFKDMENKSDNRFFYKALLIFVGVRF